MFEMAGKDFQRRDAEDAVVTKLPLASSDDRSNLIGYRSDPVLSQCPLNLCGEC